MRNAETADDIDGQDGPDGSDHDRAVDTADALHLKVRSQDVVALAAITITSDGEVSLHQPPEQVADEPLVVFAIVGALKAMADNLTQMLKTREHRKPKEIAAPVIH
jgi:hypothetical protein